MMESTTQPGDMSICLTGQYDFVVTEELLQIMESQKRVEVKWTFDDRNAKGKRGNNHLHEDFADYKHLLEPMLPDTQKQSSVVQKYDQRFMLTPPFMETSGMIGHLFILKNKMIKRVLSKLTTHHEYLVMCPLMVN